MMHWTRNNDDVRLRAHFETLRGERNAQAGTYHATVGAAAARNATRGRRRILSVAIAASAPLVIAVVLVGQERASARAAAAAAARIEPLVAWRSPTASLLETPYTDWLRTTPTLGGSVIKVTSTYSGGTQ